MFSQIKDIKHIKQDFLFCSLCLAPELGLGGVGALRGRSGGPNFFFPNIVMWHIKLKEMMSRTECK